MKHRLATRRGFVIVPLFLTLTMLAWPAARAQEQCQALGQDAGAFAGLGCLTALAADTEFQVLWTLAAGDLDSRPVTATLSAAPGQLVEVTLLDPAGEPARILWAQDGMAVAATWHLLPAEYALSITSSGSEGRFALELDNPGPALSLATEPAGTSEFAAHESGAFERIGSLYEGADYIRWHIPAEAAGRSWLIQAAGTPGHPLTFKLYDADGNELMHYRPDSSQWLEVREIQVPPGVNTFALGPVGDNPSAGYHLRAVLLGEVANGFKRGRPDNFDSANRIDVRQGVVGALEEDDADYYRLVVAPAEAGEYELALGNAEPMTLCIHGADRMLLACFAHGSLLRVPLLRLEAGEYWLVVWGTRGQGHAYWLHFNRLEVSR